MQENKPSSLGVAGKETVRTLRARNANEAYYLGMMLMEHEGKRQNSRNGPTIEIDEPVGLMYELPRERVLFSETRDSNPFLGFFEALWILEGRDDVKFLADIVGNMASYSDDGYRFYGSYGRRLRNLHPGMATGGENDEKRDQIWEAISRLKCNRDDRRVTMMIRNPSDMWYNGKDTPCNLLVDCKVRDGKLNISVFNRSNDFVWGMLGTNVVQFSTLQEYMAGMIGVQVGTYHQITTSMHVYLNYQWEKVKDSGTEGIHQDYYSEEKVQPYDMMQGDPYDWHTDLHAFFKCYDNQDMYLTGHQPKSPYFKEVVWPMWKTFQLWKVYRKNKDVHNFIEVANMKNNIAATDWRMNVAQWMTRREYK